MQTDEVTKYRNRQGLRVTLLSLLTFLVSSTCMFMIYQDRVETLRTGIPRNTTELETLCTSLQVHAEARRACRLIDELCWQNATVAGEYQACYKEAVTEQFDTWIAAIETDTIAVWEYMWMMIVGACFVTTLVQWYCGCFAACLGQNKTLVTFFVLFNAIFAGFFIREFAQDTWESWILLVPICLHAVCAYYGAHYLMRQAQISALPADGAYGFKGSGTMFASIRAAGSTRPTPSLSIKPQGADVGRPSEASVLV